MADLGKVEGGKLGPGPEGPKRKKSSEPDRFREMMKSGKVRETDPEEQRKRKSQAEREEEEAAEMTTAQPSNRDIITPSPSGDFEIKIPESAGVSPAEEPAAPTPQPSIYEPPVAPEEHYPLAETEPTVSTPQQPRTERRRQVEQRKEPIVEKGKKVEKPAEKKVAAHPPGKKPVSKKEIVETKPPQHVEVPKKQKKPAETCSSCRRSCSAAASSTSSRSLGEGRRFRAGGRKTGEKSGAGQKRGAGRRDHLPNGRSSCRPCYFAWWRAVAADHRSLC